MNLIPIKSAAVFLAAVFIIIAASSGCSRNAGQLSPSTDQPQHSEPVKKPSHVPPGTALSRIFADAATGQTPLGGSLAWDPMTTKGEGYELSDIRVEGEKFEAVWKKTGGNAERLKVTGRIEGDRLEMKGGEVLDGPRKGRNGKLRADMRFGFGITGVRGAGRSLSYEARGQVELDGKTYPKATLAGDFKPDTEWQSFRRSIGIRVGEQAVLISGLEDVPSPSGTKAYRGYWYNDALDACFSVLVQMTSGDPSTLEIIGGDWCWKPAGATVGAPDDFRARATLDPSVGYFVGTYEWGAFGSGTFSCAAEVSSLAGDSGGRSESALEQIFARVMASESNGVPGGMFKREESVSNPNPDNFYELHDIQMNGHSFEAVFLWRKRRGDTERLKVTGEVAGDRLTMQGGEVLDGSRQGRNLGLRADLRYDEKRSNVSGLIELDGYRFRWVTFQEGWSETYRSQQGGR